MKRNIAYLLTLALLVATSCSNEVEQIENSADTAIEFTASMADGSRAANGLQTVFATSDQVGMYIVTSKGSTTSNMADNKLFELKSSGYLEATDGTRYFYPGSSYTTKVYAYKPYSAQGIVNNAFRIATDQTSDAGYIASDLLWGVPKNGNPVSASRQPIALNFEHRCAKLVVNLTVADGMNLEGCELSTSSMETGMKLSSLESGTFDVRGYYYYSSVKFGKLTSAASQTHAAVLVPQKFQAGWTFLNINFANGNKKLAMKLPSALDLEAGKVYTLSVTARRNSLVVDNMTITPWTASEQHDGAIVEDKVLNLSTLPADFTVDTNFILTGTTSHKITVADGVTLTLKDATINNQIKCVGDATITLKGTNTVACTTTNRAGIEAGPSGTTLTVNGSGLLTATGGQNGAGIGSGDNTTCGAITISGGTIVATGGTNAAGIGSGNYSPSCGAITITGGTITANGKNGAAGIGSGRNYSSCGDIKITDGTIVATGGAYAAGIGSGFNSSSCGAITISGGTISANGDYIAAGIGTGRYSSCGAITITGLSETLTAKAGYEGVCIGLGYESNTCGDINVTNCTRVVLDNSETNSTYFNPNPTDFSGSHFYDEDGSEITF